MLPEQHLGALLILKYGFFYLVPLPFEWDLKRGIGLAKTTFWRMFSLYLYISILAVNCLGSWYVVGSYCFFNPERTDMDFAIVAMNALAGYVGLFLIFYICYGLHYQKYLEMANDCILYGDSIMMKYPSRKDNYRFLDWFSIPTALGAISTPWALIVTGMFSQIDPFFYVVQDLSSTSPYELTRWQIYSRVAFRFLMLSCILETSRVIGLAAVTAIALCYKARRVMEIISSWRLSYRQLMLRYREISIMYTVWTSIVYPATSAALSTVFWGLVFCGWVTVKWFRALPIFIFLTLIAAGLMLVTGLFMGLRLASNCSETGNELVRRCRLITAWKYSRARSGCVRWFMKLRMLEANAMRKISLQYYPFMKIDKEFIMRFMENLLNRWMESLLVL